ncbi:class I SAM-dependent DNA methyltransferase [Modestobacter sp. SSW1-42]|uniref:class I SAM-dependent DNA methyltransferase n=1 Tax=Modestobacter sp. SSW1-42 TaxID=596372 RepID=UPI00398724A6
MDLEPVRAAYASVAAQYVDLFDRGWPAQEDPGDLALVERHLVGLAGPVLDLGCGPGQWTGHLHARGADVTGVDVVPAFVAHARAAHPGPAFVLGSMTGLDLPAHSVAGVLAWYSTIHLPPASLDDVLAGFRRLLAPGGTLVVGFFDSEDGVVPFDHRVRTAFRWPVEVFAQRLAEAGFTELERRQRQSPDRPDRRYAAIAARAT